MWCTGQFLRLKDSADLLPPDVITAAIANELRASGGEGLRLLGARFFAPITFRPQG
jgi:hypothetical protein